MSRIHECAANTFNDITAFLAVARERSFTKAAAQARRVAIGAQPHHPRARGAAGSAAADPHHAQRAPTEAGERLLRTVGPRFEEIEAELAALSELRDKPAGTIRITATEYAADTVLWPKLAKFLPRYPDIKVEIIIDYGLTDIVAQRIDAGVRSGEQVAKDMIAVRIGPDMRMAVVGAPAYFAEAARTEEAAGPDRPQLHQSAPADPWRIVRLGIREGQRAN